jgi:hypothetical protein
MKAPWVVNVQASGEKPAPSVGHTFGTKREARAFVASLGQLALDARVDRRTYSVRVKPKR